MTATRSTMRRMNSAPSAELFNLADHRPSPNVKRDAAGNVTIQIVAAAFASQHFHQPVVTEGRKTIPVSMADLRGRAPERKWTVQDWIPSGVVTGLYGDGGVGKTLLALQLQASTSLGRRWLGVEVENCTSIGVYCEDDQDELHRRRDDIADVMECDIEHLSGAIIWPRLGEDNLLMTFSGRSGKGETTPFHKELLTRALDERAKIVIFDGASDGFGGDEINRTQVRAFVSIACGSIAKAIGGAFVLLAHPSRAGMETGRGDSGSNSMEQRFPLAALY